MDCSNETTFAGIEHILNCLNTGAVATITVCEEFVTETREFLQKLKQNNHIQDYRVIVKHVPQETDNSTTCVTSFAVDHLQQFEQYVKLNIGDHKVVEEELQYIMR